MAIFYPRYGNLFDCDIEDVVFVTTVNCRGAMGAGIALECKQRYPEIYQRYQEQCRNGVWRPGMVACFIANDESKHLLVATKDDWRYPSKMEWVKTILEKIAVFHETLNINAIAISHLGAGNGKLDPSDVRAQMDDILGPTLLDIYLYGKTGLK